MKYETPELTALNAAVDAIQGSSLPTQKNRTQSGDGVQIPAGQAANEHMVGYADWE